MVTRTAYADELSLRRRGRARHRERQGASAADMNALCFTDQQLALLRKLAAPLRPKQRGRFLDLVSKYLAGCEVGDATVHMAGLRAQQELRREEPWLQA